MNDLPTHDIAYVGKLRWRFRLRPLGQIFKDVWRLACGYERTIICRRDDLNKTSV
jgi:hypothetical protein